MEKPLYSVLTWDAELERFTPQIGLASESINVDLSGLRRCLRELRQMGYAADRSDNSVLVERTDGAPLGTIIASQCLRPTGPVTCETMATGHEAYVFRIAVDRQVADCWRKGPTDYIIREAYRHIRSLEIAEEKRGGKR